MSAEFENIHIDGNEPVGGYFIDEKIRERLLQNPDHVMEDKIRGRNISVLFGKQRKSEDPPFSVYCLIINTDGSSSEIVAGGRTRDDALRGVGLEVYRFVKGKEQMTQGRKTSLSNEVF